MGWDSQQNTADHPSIKWRQIRQYFQARAFQLKQIQGAPWKSGNQAAKVHWIKHVSGQKAVRLPFEVLDSAEVKERVIGDFNPADRRQVFQVIDKLNSSRDDRAWA